MNRLDENIENMAYILDCLTTLRNILETGDCNNCRARKDCVCKPGLGQMVRYNCPFYKKDGGGNG